jgi:hypothetical protein
MKYYKYFEKKLRESFPDMRGIDSATLGFKRLEFKNGETFQFDFSTLDRELNNANYKKEIYDTIQEISQMRKAPINLSRVKTLEKFKRELEGFYKSVEITENDDFDRVSATTFLGEVVSIDCVPDIIDTEEHSNQIVEHLKRILKPVPVEGIPNEQAEQT